MAMIIKRTNKLAMIGRATLIVAWGLKVNLTATLTQFLGWPRIKILDR